MISTLLPFEYRSRDGVVHDLRTLAPIGRATTSVSVQQSTQQQQPHPPPPQQQQQQQQQQQPNHSARYRPSPSPSPLSFDTSSEQQQQQHVTSSGTTVSVPPLAADYTESNVNLERECIIGLLRRLQSMERAVELSSAATTAPGSSGRSVVSAALSLADVEAAILDSAGEDLIESLLMASLHNIAELDAATATAAVAAGAPMAQGKGYLSPPSNNGGAVSSSMFAAALSKRGSGSALHAAAMRSATPSVSPSLLELASARDSAGRQLVHFVAGLGYTSLLSVLLSQLSADVNSQDHSHRTPLHYAVLASDEFEGGGGAQMSAAGSPAALMVSALLSFGADDRLMDRAGRTALALADLHGRRHIVQVFLEVQNAESLEFDTVAHASSSSSQPHHQQQQQQQRGGDPAQRHHAHPASIETGSTSDNGNRDRSIALTAPATTASQRPGAHEFLSVSSDTEEEEGGGVDEDGSDDNDDDDDDEQMYAAAAASAFAAPSSSNGTSVHAVSGSNISAGATATMSSNGTNASPSAPSSSSSSFPLDRAFSSLTLHDMGISQATLASFDAPLGAADLFSSSTPAFARVVRKVQRQIRWWLFRRHVAAQKLQSVARGMLARRGLKRLRESAQVIQSAFKARKVRRDFVQLRRATKFIQDKFRHARGGGGVSPMSASAVGGGGGGGNASAGSTGPSTTPASANMMRPHLLRPISLSIGPGITSGGGGAESGGGGGESSSIRGASATPAAAAAGGGGSASESESATVERKRSRYLQPPPALQHTSIPSVHDSNLSGDEAGRPLSSLGGLPFRFSPTASMLLSSSAAASSSTVAAAAASSAADGGHGSMSPDALSLLLPDTDADADGEPRSLSLSLAPPLPSSSDATGEDEAGAATSGPFFTLPSMLQLDDPHILAMQLHEPGQLVSPALRSLSRTHQEASAASGHATHMLVQ
jgi:ankyrin repeat protein